MNQFGFLLRKADLKLYARKYFDVFPNEVLNAIPGNTSSSRIEKELTEAMGMFCATREFVKEQEACLVIDLCCGKGWSALLMHQALRCKVLAIDNAFGRMSESHLKFLRERRDLSLLDLDLLSTRDSHDLLDLNVRRFLASSGVAAHSSSNMFDNFSDSSRRRREELKALANDLELKVKELEAENARDEKAIIMSIHPCGLLANRVLDCFEKIGRRKGDLCILMPCCCGPGPAPSSYAEMCENLAAPFRSKGDYSVSLIYDPNVCSDKNGIITIVYKPE